MDDLTESMEFQTGFFLQLAKHVLSSRDCDSNLVFSPPSIYAALALVAVGSKGETKEQILSVLRSNSADDLQELSSYIASIVLADGSSSGGPKLAFANSVWVDSSLSLNPTFKEVVTLVFKADTKAVDFLQKAEEARLDVNHWIQRKTGGLISEILPPGSVDCMTRLVLSNALYFKGIWNESFDASQTNDNVFHLHDGNTVQVPFMTSNKEQYLSAFDDFKVLRMPYKQGESERQFSMYIFLPEAPGGFSILVENLCSKPGFLDRHIPRQKVKIGYFKLPKFKISFGFEASHLLKTMGLILPFGASADISEIVTDSTVGRELYVDKVFHRSFVEVNEEGTEAAAATAVVIQLRGLMRIQPLNFVADHPFLFVIREDTSGLVLFIGQVMNPQVEL